MSNAAKMNGTIETDYDVAGIEALADVVHNNKNIAANISSGSYRTIGMIVAPCSMKTLGSIVNSISDNLLVRAADVVLKERRPLVLMARESPLHTGHTRLMYEASQMGAIIAPPTPAFYNRPKTVDDIVNHSVGRVLDFFDIDPGVVKRWEGTNPGLSDS
jgi:4-hydroxy-3-polyprenylbenzoate decarboxylase